MARSYTELVSQLSKSASARKSASAGVPSVPEKDPNETGAVTPPAAPSGNSGSAAAGRVPESSTNADKTPAMVPPTPIKTVEGDEKVASKALKAVNALKSLMGKNAGDRSGAGNPGDPASVTPTKAPVPANVQVDDTLPPNTQSNKDAAPKDNAPKDPAEKAPGSGSGDKMPDVPPTPTNTDVTKAAEMMKEKCASAENMLKEFGIDSPEFYIKVAHLIMSCEEGREMVQTLAEKEAGRQAAENLIKSAMITREQLVEAENAYAQGADQAQEMYRNAPPEVQASIVKMAKVHGEGREQFEYDFEKRAYDAGAMGAAQMEDAGMMGDQPPADYDPNAIQDSDIVTVLDQMVQAGQISQEQAVAILQALQGGDAGAAAGGAAPADAGAAAAAGAPADGGAGAPPMPPAAAPAAPAPDKAPPKEKSEDKPAKGEDKPAKGEDKPESKDAAAEPQTIADAVAQFLRA